MLNIGDILAGFSIGFHRGKCSDVLMFFLQNKCNKRKEQRKKTLNRKCENTNIILGLKYFFLVPKSDALTNKQHLILE